MHGSSNQIQLEAPQYYITWKVKSHSTKSTGYSSPKRHSSNKKPNADSNPTVLNQRHERSNHILGKTPSGPSREEAGVLIRCDLGSWHGCPFDRLVWLKHMWVPLVYMSVPSIYQGQPSIFFSKRTRRVGGGSCLVSGFQ